MSPQTPPLLDATLGLVGHLDRALAHGLARIAPAEREGLETVAAALHHTPLGPTFRASLDAIIAGDLLGHHIAVLAAARAGLMGAAHDALQEAAAAHLGYQLAEDLPAPPPAAPSATTRTLMDSAQQWLVELALGGFVSLDRRNVHPMLGSLRPLQEHAPLVRLAAVLTGFATELLETTPMSAETLPLRRLGDLWTVAMLNTVALPSPSPLTPVSGTVTPLGLDLRHHDHVVAAVIHAALETPDQPTRLVRVHVSAWKVDAIAGFESLTLLTALAPKLFAAFTTPGSFAITAFPLSRAGDLTWDDEAATPVPGVDVSLAGAIAARPEPRDRHPLQLALPFVSTEAPTLPTRGASPWLEADALYATRGATGFTSLLRWDATWFAQPLEAQTKKGAKGLADALEKAVKLKDLATPVLRERASRLLRKS